MPIVIPKIDDLNYDRILAEALARIPVHNPEWTNFNNSDPGVTLLQLFAFMTENLLYRSNLIPERNRIKFMKLLGIPMQAPAAAQGMVTFSNPRGPLKTQTLTSGMEILAGKLPFQTLDGLDVLPIEGRVYYKAHIPAGRRDEIKKDYELLYGSFQSAETEPGFYETKPLDPPLSGAVIPIVDLSRDTIDKSLWIALLARSKDVLEQTREDIGNKVLTLGILPGINETGRVLRPGGTPSSQTQPDLIYQIPVGGKLSSVPQERIARYKNLESWHKGDPLSEPSIVQVQLPGSDELRLWENIEPLEPGAGNFPPSLEDTAIRDRLITWICIRIRSSQTLKEIPGNMSVCISWAGINAARVIQCAHVLFENLGLGTGEPDQTVTLANTPVIQESVNLKVNGEDWKRIDDLMAADPEVPVRSPGFTPAAASAKSGTERAKVFTVDRESGEIRFGDGIRGTRPPRGATIRASYDYGGGISGNVGIGTINKGPNLPAGLKVNNPLPAWGGDEGESIEEAQRNIPAYVRHQDRLISAQDFEEITSRTPGVDLGRIDVLPLVHPDIPDAQSEGVVTVMVIPRYDPVQPEAPVPDRLFLETVCKHLEPRRIITTELHVRGPKYIGAWISIGIEVIPGRDIAPVREGVKNAIRQFLSPLTGGFSGKGWPLEKTIEKPELLAVATRVDGISMVNAVLLADETGSEKEKITMKGLELPRLMGLSVQPGDPQEIAAITGYPAGPPSEEAPSKNIFPVPVIPPECR